VFWKRSVRHHCAGIDVRPLIAQILTLVSINGMGELVDGGGHLQSNHKDSLLSLDTDVLRPSHKTRKVSFGLDVTSNSKVTGALLEERALSGGGTSSGDSNDDLLSFDSFLHLLRNNCLSIQKVRYECLAALLADGCCRILTMMIDIFYLINNNQS